LIKGCKLAIYNTVLLAQENKQLQLENAQQKQKREIKKKYIDKGGFLTVEEALERAREGQAGPVEPEGGVEDQCPVVKTHALQTCSMCRSLLHTACICLLRQASN
jgi:hypothetical protein